MLVVLYGEQKWLRKIEHFLSYHHSPVIGYTSVLKIPHFLQKNTEA